jgi:hypothetical protein
MLCNYGTIDDIAAQIPSCSLRNKGKENQCPGKNAVLA